MYNKVFPAELDCLYEMLSFIKDYGVSHHISSTVLDQIILATEEVLVNIISYGYPEGMKGTIAITCEKPTHREGIKMIIKDRGIPFNPLEKASSHPPLTAKGLNQSIEILGGYGIDIFMGLMDCVDYQRVKEDNVLSLTKYL